jgi:hypothetical protein
MAKMNSVQKGRIIGFGVVFGLSGLMLVVPRLASLLPDIEGSGPVSRGDTHYVGARNCDKAIKAQLSDPASFERIATQIVDVKPGSGWVARTAFRARNGFGGFVEGTADCLFDGNSYRAVVMQ